MTGVAHCATERRVARTGSLIVNVVPTPTVLSHEIDPPCASTICFAIASPKPGPGGAGGALVVGLIELLEDARQLLGRNPGARVRSRA